MYPQSNGQAESAVKLVKRIYYQSEDPYLGLLAYRNTPLAGLGASPSQLSMSRYMRSKVPQHPTMLQPQPVTVPVIQQRDEKRKLKQKEHFDKRHGTRTMAELNPGDTVWVRDKECLGLIMRHAAAPRSYIVKVTHGLIRRNRIHLAKLSQHASLNPYDNDLDLPEIPDAPLAQPLVPPDPIPPLEEDPLPAVNQQQSSDEQDAPIPQSRSGRVIRIPARYKN
jgi:hypothetical protein